MRRRLFSLLLALSVWTTHAQPSDDRIPFLWLDAELSMLISPDWNARTHADPPRLTFQDGNDAPLLTLIVLPETISDAVFYDTLFAAVRDAGLFPVDWRNGTHFGRFSGWIETDQGVSQIARLPDDRVLLWYGADDSISVIDTLIFGVNEHPNDLLAETIIAVDVPVVGALTADQPAQTWFYDGLAGEVVTVAAVDLSRSDPYDLRLDMEIAVSDPNGVEIATNDDHAGIDLYGIYDAQLRDLTLPADGRYRIDVRSVQATSGMYTLGVSRPRPFTLDESGIARLDGRIQGVFPRQRWRFEGRQGQIVTITMTAASGTLDPLLELFSPSGRRVAYNDDAADPVLGVNAQIVRAELPRDGTYTLDATRFSGTGAYSLVIAAS
jgi:hypothetical protein